MLIYNVINSDNYSQNTRLLFYLKDSSVARDPFVSKDIDVDSLENC